MSPKQLVVLVTAAWLAVRFASIASCGQPAVGQAGDEPKYIRLRENEEARPVALEVAIVSFVGKPPLGRDLRVDLVSAIHVAEAAYFADLNRRFRNYDVVLYELVAPAGTRVPKGGGRPTSAVSLLQNGMKDVLGLKFQLEEVDYTRRNFVHADMTPKEFQTSMQNRGESVFGMFVRAMGHSFVQQSRDFTRTNDLKLIAALLSKDRERELKTVLAQQFVDLDGFMDAYNGTDGSTLVTERNKKALAVLAHQIKAGKKKIAIFYGAGHMPDLQQRLKSDFDLVPDKTEWVAAWDLSEVPATTPDEEHQPDE